MMIVQSMISGSCLFKTKCFTRRTQRIKFKTSVTTKSWCQLTMQTRCQSLKQCSAFVLVCFRVRFLNATRYQCSTLSKKDRISTAAVNQWLASSTTLGGSRWAPQYPNLICKTWAACSNLLNKCLCSTSTLKMKFTARSRSWISSSDDRLLNGICNANNRCFIHGKIS